MDKSSKGAQRIKKILLPSLFVLLVASLAATGLMYQQVQTLKNDPQRVAQQEVSALLASVGELMVLPTDETPTVATVSDPEKLREQAFFAQAQVGDKVLLYTKAKKAVLYSPTAHKIVEVAPINIGQNTEEANPEVAGATDESESDTELTP